MSRIEIAEAWERLVTQIQEAKGTVMVMGAPDSGKTTLTRYLVKELSERGESVAYIDGDMGQSVLGPPATQGMAVLDNASTDLEKAPVWLYFIGSTSPRKHGRETLVGLRKLLDRSQTGREPIAILDTTGYVSGEDALELKYQKIDLLNPRHIVAMQRDKEIEHILKTQRGREEFLIHRLSSPAAVQIRSPDERRGYRWNRFQEYFAHLSLYHVDLSQMSLTGAHEAKICGQAEEELTGLLLGLNGPDNFLVTLGILENLDHMKGMLSCLVPSGADLERIRTIRIGSIRIDLSEERNGERYLDLDRRAYSS